MSQIPSSIGRYEVMNPIGQGGMGSLFLAWDPRLERKIAIKLLRDDDESLRERFSREARAAARLRHPNIVTIFDVGEHDGQPFIAMEYIQGHTLAEMIHRKAPMPIARKLELFEALCDGLGFAHKSGIVHRDIKPANLMVDAEGALKILDFGIARATESSGMTQAGMLIGTLNYMSPEQVSGATVDARSDIFAVGAVFYEMITHRQAFPGGLLAGVLNKILTAQFEPIASIAPDVDPEVVRIVNRALDRDPAKRYQELQSMRKELLFVRMRLETQPDAAESPTIVSEAPTIVVPTPTPVRRTSDREDLMRRRAQQIDQHLADAEQKLAAGDLEGAVASSEHALVIDADHVRANALLDRARAALEARQRAAAIRDLLGRGQTALDRNGFADAIALADQALAVDASSADAQALRTRAIQAREAHERAAHEARARQAVAVAQRTFDAGRYDDAIAGLASFAPPHELATSALERLRAEARRIADQKRAEAERSARIAREAGAHVDAAADLLGRGQVTDALARVNAAIALDAGHQAARALRARVDAALREEQERKRAEEAARRAEEAAARQREKASAAAIKQARKAKTPEAAIVVLGDALRADPDNAELQLLLQTREAEQARIAAEKQRAAELAEQQRQAALLAEQQRKAAAEAERQRQAIEAEKRRAAEAERQRQAAAEQQRRDTEAEKRRQAQAEADRQRQAQAEAERQRQAQAEAERQRQAQAVERQRQLDLQKDREKTQPLPVPAAAAASARPAASTPAVAEPRKATEPPKAARPGTAATRQLPALNTQQVALIGAAAAVLLVVVGYFAFGGSDSAPPPQDAEVPTAQNASPPPPATQGAQGTSPPAPSASAARPQSAPQPPPQPQPQTQSATTDPKPDPVAQQLEDARRTARRQMQDGERFAALATVEAALRIRPNDADLLSIVRQLQTDARAGAVTARGAADAFGAHATSQQSYRDADARFADGERQAQQRRVPDAARSFWLAQELFNRAAQEGKAAKDAADREAQLKAEAAKAAPPTPAPVAKPDPPPAPPVNPDESAIRAVMQRYADAFSRSDANGVAAVTTLQAGLLRKSFGQLRSQRMQLGDLAITIDSVNRARVQSLVVHEIRPQAGEGTTVRQQITFMLEKRPRGWIIVDRRVQ